MQENEYILLLSKRFSGEISPEESQLLDEWTGQSPHHAELAEQYRLIWSKVGSGQKEFALDMDAEYRGLQQRLAASDQPRGITVPIGRQLVRAAAVLALLVTALWGYRQFAGTTPQTMSVYAGKQDKLKIDLPDGSRVWLRENGRLSYPATFQPNERRVSLDGEAYFEVAHRASQPFRVQLPHDGLVEVLGTEFNVKALAGDPETVVLVRSGKVRFFPNGGQNEQTLHASEKAEYSRVAAQIKLSRVTTFNELAWQSGGLEFIRTPLKDVVADLEKYYGVKIELRNPALAGCQYTAPLTNQPVGQVLNGFRLIYGVQMANPEPGHFILSGGTCQ